VIVVRIGMPPIGKKHSPFSQLLVLYLKLLFKFVKDVDNHGGEHHMIWGLGILGLNRSLDVLKARLLTGAGELGAHDLHEIVGIVFVEPEKAALLLLQHVPKAVVGKGEIGEQLDSVLLLR